MSQSCAACKRTIDAAARLCPYCGANPATGDRVDTQSILQEVFRPRETTRSESVLEYARQRQGVVVAASVLAGFLLLAALHAYVTRRNQTDVTGAPAVPLSEITDVANKPDDASPQPMPDLAFQYDGNPQTMRTFIVERGATTPPEVLAAQQAAAAAKAAAVTATNPVAPQSQSPPRPQSQSQPPRPQPPAARPPSP
jgi:predicted phosphoribosyltransferase